MSTKQLAEAILDGGIRLNTFFNGRLLSGEDLTQEQAAQGEARRRLGLALGAGVAFGLDASLTPGVSSQTSPSITITQGLAVNRQGQVLSLANDTTVSLIRPVNSGAPATSGFSACEPFQSGIYIAGVGVYLLTIAPAMGTEGRAPVSGLGDITASCNTHYTVEGVQFRLIQLDLDLTELDDRAHIRNRVAYQCFGIADTSAFFSDPFGPPAEAYGLLDALRAANQLTDCDVPLALMYWTADNGIEFVDRWAVRRRLVRPATDERWPLLVGDRRVSEAEAMFLQFQDQIEDIRASEPNALSSIVATDRFAYLPPVGLLPITGDGSPAGFDPQMFFGARGSLEVATTDAGLLRGLLHESLYHEPIDLSAEGKIQLYLIWENLQAFQAQQTSQLALVFASHTLPYRGVARFGFAHWGLSRFASAVM